MPFRHTGSDYREAIDVFASAGLPRRSHAESVTKSGRGGKMSASVCVRRANEVNGRLITNAGKNSDLIRLSNH